MLSLFVADIHPSWTWMSGSFESVCLNACVHRLDLGLYSHPKEFVGNGVRTHVNSEGKIPSSRGSEEDPTHNAGSGRTASPAHYPLNYSGPFCQTFPTVFSLAYQQLIGISSRFMCCTVCHMFTCQFPLDECVRSVMFRIMLWFWLETLQIVCDQQI